MEEINKTAANHLTQPMLTGQVVQQLPQCERPSHPLQSAQTAFAQQQRQRDVELIKAIQGKAAAMMMGMEMRIAGRSDRLPGLRSSHLQQRILRAADCDVGFEDQLNLPEHCEVMGQPHAIMEKRLGLI